MTTARYRTIWVSDTHLGTRGCQAQALLEFLDGHECEYLYLVGDIIDFWRLKRASHWAQLHSDVIRTVLSKARAGTTVTLVPGNHDEYLRRFCDLQLGNIMVTREAIHRTADGRLLLVVHGHEFDGITRCHRWVALTGRRRIRWPPRPQPLVQPRAARPGVATTGAWPPMPRARSSALRASITAFETAPICRRARHSALIFDEVYTGFRLAPGGAQAYFGVQADVAVYGKTVAGGMPIGVVCGRKALMRRFDPERPMRIAYVE